MKFIRSTFSPLQQIFAATAIFALVLSLVYGVFPANQAVAVVQLEFRSEVQVKICHADGVDFSEGKQEVDAESVLKTSGHGSHTDKGLDDKGDIIAPFDYEYRVKNTDSEWTPDTYAGRNLTTVYSGGYTGQDILNNDCNLPTPPEPKADLSIVKTVDDATPDEGTNVTFTLTVTNAGPNTATGVTVTDTLPIGLTYVSSNPSATVNGAQLTWSLGSLSKDGSAVITVTATVGAEKGDSSITNTSSVTGTLTDPVTTNNSESEVITVQNVVVLCTDPNANNQGQPLPCTFDPSVIPGCMDQDATNYEPTATVEDHSCTYLLTVKKQFAEEYDVSFSAFSFLVNNGATTTFDGSGTNVLTLLGGTYTVNEVPNAGYTPSYDQCSGIVLDGPKTCTITNTKIVELCVDERANNVGEPLPCTYDVPPVCTVGNNLLANGSFEDPIVGGSWSIFPVVSNWSISSDGLELWRNFMGGPSDGAQNAELDGNQPTSITQTAVTTPGATYELRFDFSPRPNTGLADNSVDALADNTLLLNASGDGSSLSNTAWTTYTKTFVAQDASTDVTLADKGTPNSLGSLVDDVVLCYVSAPVPGCMDPEATNYNSEATIDDESCSYGNTEPQLCTVTLVSGTDANEDSADDNTTVVEKGGALAKLLTFVHPAWTAAISGANWIWGDDPVAAPVNGVVQTFERKFGWSGGVSNATLSVASDNTYAVTVNGTAAGSDLSGDNFSSADTIDVTSFIQGGNNKLAINVTNLEGSTEPSANPAGLLYKLVITSTATGEGCNIPYVEAPVYQCSDGIDNDQDGHVDYPNDPGCSNSTDNDEVNSTGGGGGGGGGGGSPSPRCDAFDLSGNTLSWKTRNGYDMSITRNGAEIFDTTDDTEVDAGTLFTVASSGDTFELTVNRGSRNDTCTIGGVLGLGGSAAEPVGEVLGESTSTLPVGAPNTGAGGAAPSPFASYIALFGMLLSLVTLRVTKNG